jgi:hypothetical protein
VRVATENLVVDALEAANKHLRSCETLLAEQRERIKSLASKSREVDAGRRALVNMERLVEAAKARRDQIIQARGGARDPR